MSFHEQPWSERQKLLGDKAEGIFEAVAEREDLEYVRFGLNRPPFSPYNMPSFVRYTPDYLTRHCFVECKGVGKDETLKIKMDQLSTLSQWNMYHPVLFFIWNSYKRQYSRVPFDQIYKQRFDGDARKFSEGNWAWFIPLDELSEVTWEHFE